jgi:hypothetical protein
VEANSTGGLGSRRAVAPSDDDDYDGFPFLTSLVLKSKFSLLSKND